MSETKIKVLVVDDSALARKILSDLLNEHPGIEVAGTAQDGSFVVDKIEQLRPDVVTLDLEMRNKGGLEVLPEIVKRYNIPVIMVSAHTERGAESTLKALELGAFDFVTKPMAGGASLETIAELLRQKILAAGRRRIPRCNQPSMTAPTTSAPVVRSARALPVKGIELIVIGASTGGTEAIKNLLVNLPDNLPGIVIVQHMPAGFTNTFARRLDNLCAMRVSEGVEGAVIQPGTAWIAPGGRHMEVVHAGGAWRIHLHDLPPVNRHRPSVDVLFHAAAQRAKGRCLGVILTGMGNDGAVGMKALYDAGAMTIAQDETTCVVFGMPKEAIRSGGVRCVLPLNQIAPFLTQTTQARRGSSRLDRANHSCAHI